MSTCISRRYADSEVGDLVRLISGRFGYDLTSYKPSCIERRISARKRALHIDSIGEYFDYIMSNPEEIGKLIDAITIHTTRFFRDGSSFDYLREKIIPSILSNRRLHSLKVWSAGCSTGEEAYSLAIVLFDAIVRRRPKPSVKVYGTDISARACSFAREALYSGKSLSETPRSFVIRYFSREGDLYRVKKEIRKLVEFSVHDLIKEPPLEDIDIVVCRNVLIHFVEDVRGLVIRKFSQAIRGGGYLILGKSEAITSSLIDQFELVSCREKIYRKRPIIDAQGGKR